MIKKYGLWILMILILYMVTVFYIISTLKLDGVVGEGGKGGDAGVESVRRLEDNQASKLSFKQNINRVVVESSEDIVGELNLPVGRNILIEKANIRNKHQRRTSSNQHNIITNTVGSGQVKTSFRPIGDHFYVYSAYFDNRLQDSYIRIVAIGPRNQHKSGLWCHFQSFMQINHTVATEIRLMETCENHQKLVSFYLMSCLVPSVAVKEFRQNSISNIVLTRSRVDNFHFGLNLTVVNNVPLNLHQQSRFSVCVPPLYGNPKPLHFVEFIELSRLLGAEHFVIYVNNLPDEITTILKFYQNIGILTMVTWNIPDIDHIWNYGQSAAIADCLYRNMFKSRIVTFNDIDEYIIPRHLSSWRTLLTYLENKNKRSVSKVAAYKFKSSFFQGNTENVTSQWRMFNSLNNILRTKAASDIRTKLMVYPETVFELGIHHLSQPIKSHYRTFNVDMNTALVHHYRTCANVHDLKCDNFIEDYTSHRYGSMLVENTKRTLRRVKNLL